MLDLDGSIVSVEGGFLVCLILYIFAKLLSHLIRPKSREVANAVCEDCPASGSQWGWAGGCCTCQLPDPSWTLSGRPSSSRTQEEW